MAPYASAMPGQIMLMTNSAFAMNAGVASAQFDLASVAVSDVVAFQLDPGTSFINPAPNVFIAPGIGAVAGGLGGLGFLPGAGGQLGALINDVPLFSISYLVPRTGSGYFYSPGGPFSDLAGELTLMGSALDNAAFQGQYQAGSQVRTLEALSADRRKADPAITFISGSRRGALFSRPPLIEAHHRSSQAPACRLRPCGN